MQSISESDSWSIYEAAALAANDLKLSAALDDYQAAYDSMTELLCIEQFAEGRAFAVMMRMRLR